MTAVYPKSPEPGEVLEFAYSGTGGVRLTPAGERLPETLARSVRLLAIAADPDRILLFGSRARGTAGRFSDWDFALDGVRDDHGLACAEVDLKTEMIVFQDLDVVDLARAGATLRDDVAREGVEVYVRG